MTPAEIEVQVLAFVRHAKGIASDGLTISEFAGLAVDLLRLSIAAVDAIPTEGAGKKAFVLESVAMLFDGIADRLVPWAAWPVWIIAKPAIRGIVLAVASGAIESLLPLVRSSK